MTGIETVFGLPANPIDNLGSVLPVQFVNLYDTMANGGNIFGLLGQLTNGDVGCPDGTESPTSAMNYLANKRDVIEQSAYQRPLFRIGDKDMNVITEITGEMSMYFEELMTDSGTARYVVNWENWVVDYLVNLTAVEEDLHLLIDPMPSRIAQGDAWECRWAGKIHTINIEKHEDGTSTVELLAISNREHAKRLLIAAMPFFMPEVQLPRMWMLPGPCRSVLFLTMFVNLARLFLPGFSTLVNIANPFSLIETVLDPGKNLVDQINPLSWPIQCAFVNPGTDTSDWTVLGATWTTVHDATQDILRNAGCMLRAYTILVEEDTVSPYDELANLVDVTVDLGVNIIDDISGGTVNLNQLTNVTAAANQATMPTRNCVVFKIIDKSGDAGPTGTPIDGFLNTIGVTLDDLFSSVLINAGTGMQLDGEPVYDLQGNEFPIAESLLGTAPPVPKVIWREGTFSAIVNAKHTLNKGSPQTAMTGGKSPSLVNQTQTFLIKYGLSQLQTVITAGWGGETGPAPVGAGLDNLYQGQLDNVLLAWERITNPMVALWGGDLDFQEYFERGSSVAYTLSSVITLQTALWKTRAYQGMTVKVMPGRPWTVDVDTELGDRNGFEFSDVIYVDQIYGVKRELENGKALLPELTIGDNKQKEDPLLRVMANVAAVYSLLGAFVGEGTIFG